ncbi:MAG: FAD-binding protein [Desulfovibrio sp.]|uniref:FAD-binding protein n=1 Tax=Desulfovibrio sp. TaxID=885 RepID=UPI001A711A18|nr:FAD-binding protein [Desulfovibrio sp.]MBD5418066.1 FAD-binding protein [Desulfovibrio sp.]
MEIRMNPDPIVVDFLVIGGGISGLQAGITAAEAGLQTLILEKADTRRSGNGCGGNDHFMCYLPEYHGDDFEAVMREAKETLVGGNQDDNLFRFMLARSADLIRKWESYGIRMRPTGDWNFEGHAMPGRRRYHLKYDGSDQKARLTAAAKKAGAKIMNKVVVNEILVNGEGRFVGAIGIGIRDEVPEMLVFQAKAGLIAVGEAMRMYPGNNPAYMFNTSHCPANAGSGAAMALRAGARLVNLDLPSRHAGPKYFTRSGKGTWIGALTDINGRLVGPFVDTIHVSRELPDPTGDVWKDCFVKNMDSGKGPVYMNCTGISEEDLAHMRKALVSEGCTSINEYLDQYGIDLRTSMIEFGQYEHMFYMNGIDIDDRAMSTVPGLYASGQSVGNVRGDITAAAVFGDHAAREAAAYVQTVPDFDVAALGDAIGEKAALYNFLLREEPGAHWKEANSTLQKIMDEYVGTRIRSGSLLTAGRKYIRDLRKYSREKLRAENAHELMRCLEVLDLLDLAEACAVSALDRKETRGAYHRRSDFPFTNPLLNNKFQTVRRKGDDLETEFRERVR